MRKEFNRIIENNMTNEEKELLLKDLCARLKYGVKVNHFSAIRELLGIIPAAEIVMVGYDINDYEDSVIEDIEPYLRPLSSMTEEEKNEFENLGWRVDELENNEAWAFNHSINSIMKGIDWLIAHYFDFRGLIPMNLALPATEGMYNTK